MSVILVLTSGKTGSTLLMSYLRALGVNIGEPGGACEHQELGGIANGIVHRENKDNNWAVARGWKMTEGDVDKFPSYVESAKQVILKETSEDRIFAFKSPKLFYTMALWRRVLGELDIRWKAIISTRDRNACSQSIHAAWDHNIPGGINGSKKLYDFFMNTACKEVDDVTHSTVYFEDIIKDWRSVIKRVGDELNIKWPMNLSDMKQDIFVPDMVHYGNPLAN